MEWKSYLFQWQGKIKGLVHPDHETPSCPRRFNPYSIRSWAQLICFVKERISTTSLQRPEKRKGKWKKKKKCRDIELHQILTLCIGPQNEVFFQDPHCLFDMLTMQINCNHIFNALVSVNGSNSYSSSTNLK